MSPYRVAPPTRMTPPEPAEPSPAAIVAVIAIIVCVLLSSHRPPDVDAGGGSTLSSSRMRGR